MRYLKTGLAVVCVSALVLAGCADDSSIVSTNTEAPPTTLLEKLEPEFAIERTPLWAQLTAAPDSLTDAELGLVVATTSLTESWDCGIGFTLASEDQHVAVYVSQSQPDATEPPIVLPDGSWDAWLVVGNDLLANHCDDVIEEGEPERVVVAQWPIIAGTLTFTPPSISECTAVPVTGSLEAAIADAPEGPIELGTLALVNNAFGCLAG